MSLVLTNIYGQIVHEVRSAVERFYVPDPLGNTAALVDTTGAVTDSWTYWPYGEVQNHTGSSTTAFTFLGVLGYFTDAVGRLYVRARYLESILARWLTIDPLWPSQPAYTYVAARPCSVADRFGLNAAVLGGAGGWFLTGTATGAGEGAVGAGGGIAIGGAAATGGIIIVGGILVFAGYKFGCWIADRLYPTDYAEPIPRNNCSDLLDYYQRVCGSLPMACAPGDSCVTIDLKMAAYLTCALARRTYKLYCLDQSRWDPGHQGQIRVTTGAYRKCLALWLSKGCGYFYTGSGGYSSVVRRGGGVAVYE